MKPNLLPKMTDITIARTGDKITVTDGERTTSVPYGTENAATRMLTYLTDNPKTAAKMLHEYAKSSLTKKRTPTPDGAIVTSTGDKITVTRSANVIVVSDGQRKVQSICLCNMVSVNKLPRISPWWAV